MGAGYTARPVRIVVTGPSGFVGSSLCAVLRARGHDVLPLSRTLWASDGGRDFFRRERPDALVHTAWAARPPDYLQTAENCAALAWTCTLFQACIDAEVPHVVGFGTCIECGPRMGPRREDLPPDPRTPYAAAKAAAFLFAEQLFRHHAATRFAWVRPFHLFGEGEDPRRLVPTVISALRAGRPVDLSPGAQKRDWIDVADACIAVAQVLESHASGPFHLCTGESEDLRTFLGRFAALSGRPDLLRFGARPYGDGEEMDISGGTERLLALGWRPARSRADRCAALWSRAVERP